MAKATRSVTEATYISVVDAAYMGAAILSEISSLFHAILQEIDALGSAFPTSKLELAHIERLSQIGKRESALWASSIEADVKKEVEDRITEEARE